MTEWRGLHEQDYHSPWLDGIRALCTICQQDCEADDVCYCCQRNAEVERLTERVRVLELERETLFVPKLSDARKRIEAALHVLDTSQTDIAAELEHAVREALRGESDV